MQPNYILPVNYYIKVNVKKNPMKKLTLFISVFLFSIALQAQNNTTDISLVAQSLNQEKMNKKDCVMMKSGKMLVMKDGKTMDMNGDVVLSDGSVVSTNGTVKAKDGSTKMLKNGDSVDMNGNWERMDRKPNDTPNKDPKK
jgi:hypothetical protein